MSKLPTIPGYRIERELGQGGMARVYLAHEDKLDRAVALKVLPPALAEIPNATEHFIREAKTSATLVHSNIVTIHDVGSHGDVHYMAMEFLEGGSLKDRILRGPIDAATALSIVRQVASALDYAHARGYVHRDIKPDNIMFRGDGTAVVTDFGIARAVDGGSKLTKTGMSIGTPHYMSPEQARGRPLDGRSDLYALGIVLHEMLTGHVPFDGEDSVAIIMKHAQEPPPRLAVHLAQYQQLVDALLAKDPDQRLPTGARLCELIDGIFGGRPTPAAGIGIAGTMATGIGPGPRDRERSYEVKVDHGSADARAVARPARTSRSRVALLLAGALGILLIALVVVMSRDRAVPAPAQPPAIPSVADSDQEDRRIQLPPHASRPPTDTSASGAPGGGGTPQESSSPPGTATPPRPEPAAEKVEEVVRTSPRVREVARDGRFIAYADGTVLDSTTNLMWAAEDNGSDISWDEAERYCRNFGAGGYSGWRLPTISELSTLSAPSVQGNNGFHLTTLITLSGCCPWASETQGTDIAAYFTFFRSSQATSTRSFTNGKRALPVRSYQ